jgi:hypothetical protein
VVRHIFQACPVWIYTRGNNTSIIVNIVRSFKSDSAAGAMIIFQLISFRITSHP